MWLSSSYLHPVPLELRLARVAELGPELKQLGLDPGPFAALLEGHVGALAVSNRCTLPGGQPFPPIALFIPPPQGHLFPPKET